MENAEDDTILQAMVSIPREKKTPLFSSRPWH